MVAQTNGHTTDRSTRLLEALVHNALTLRREVRQLMDPRRSIEDECGYPSADAAVPAETYQRLYEREAVATRVVEVLPKESWQVTPSVYEAEDADTVTAFEQGWDGLGRQLRGEQCYYRDEEGSPLWDLMLRADILSGIGPYGVILLGLDDGLPLDRPAAGVIEQGAMPAGRDASGTQVRPSYPGPYSFSVNAQAGRRLLYASAFPSALAEITRYETNPTSPRYGLPAEYAVALSDPAEAGGVGRSPLATARVHWSRVIHLADNQGESRVFGVPRMRPVLNRLLDLRKVYASDAEAYWRNVMMKIFLGTHPQLGGDVNVDLEDMKDAFESMMNGQQHWMFLRGMSAQPVAPAVVDPTSHIAVLIEAVCVQLGVPVRVFKGSERGELASSQDDQAWNDRLRQRQRGYLTPKVIVPFVDRLITLGVLPKPEGGYTVWWPDLTSQTEAERAQVASAKTAALAQYVSGGVEAVIPPLDYLTRILGMDEEEASAVLGSASEAVEGEETDTGASPLLKLVGGITGMIELFKLAKDGGLTEEQLKQQIMLFFKVDEAKAQEIIADGLASQQPGGSAPATAPAPAGNRRVRNCGGPGSGVPGPCPSGLTKDYDPAGAAVSANAEAKSVGNTVYGKAVGDSDFARSVAAQPGSKVIVRAAGDGINVDVRHKDYDAVREIYRDGAGKLVCENQSIDIRPSAQGKGLGTQILSQQVKELSSQGFDRIQTSAVRSSGENGYYTWARLGYDGPLPQKSLDKLPPSLAGAKTVHELMAKPGGAAWWKENGTTFKGTFDLKPGSASRQILESYQIEKAKKGG